MNLIDPQDLATALRPILNDAEKNIAATVADAVAKIDEAIQLGLDRLHGIKVNASMTVDVPPRATPAP